MADILFTLKGEADGLKAVIKEVIDANQQISDSAKKAGKDASTAFKETADAAKAAFASGEVKKALDNQLQGVDALKAGLKQLYDEEIKLLAAGKKQSEAYAANQVQANKLRADIDKLTKSEAANAAVTEKNVKAQKSLSGQLKDLKNQLAQLEAAGQDGTIQFNKLAIAAGKLEDQIGDTRERVRVLASDTFVFDAAIDATKNLAGAFSLAEGVIGAFTDDQEQLQKVIARTNSVMAILNGLQEVQAAITGQGAAKIALMTVAQNINAASTRQAAAAQALFGESVLFTSRAFNILKGALLASGIGAVILLIGFLIQQYDKFQETLARTKRVLDDSNEAMKNSAKALTNYKERLIEASDELAVANGTLAKSVADINKQQRDFVKQLSGDLKPLIQSREELLNIQAREEEKLSKLTKGTGLYILTNSALVSVKNRIAETDKRIDEIKTAAIKTQRVELELIRKNNEESKKTTEQKQQEARVYVETSELKTLALNKQIQAELELQGVIVQARETQLEIESNVIKKTEILFGSSLDRRINLIRLEGEQRKIQAQNSISDQQEQATAVELIEAETQAAIREERKKTNDETIKQIFEYVNAIGSAFSAINDLSKQQTENRIADINAQYQAELTAINGSLETERQQQRERAALEFRTNRLISAEKTKQAKRDKALALFQVGLNTAEAVSKSIAESPQTFGLPFSAFAVAQGIIQAGIIASKPIPKFEKGGQVGGKRHSQGGTLIEAEEGEFITNRVQAGKHKSALEAMNKSSEAFRAYIDKHYVRPAVMNYVLSNKRSDSKISVNATLNSKSMEHELRGMRKDMKKQAKQSFKTETRYAWHNN